MKYIHLIFITIILTACNVGKKIEKPDVPLPAQFNNNPSFADTSSIADIEWKDFFSDTNLTGLISSGIQYNFDMQLALKRIDIARQQVIQTGFLWFPSIDLRVGGQYNRPSNNSLNGLSASNFLGKKTIENYQAGVNLSWEADIWGKIRKQKETALAQYLQTNEAAKAVQTQLVADIAQGYFNLQILDKQLEITRRNLSLSDSFLTATQLLKDAGEINALAVQQAAAQKETAAQLIPQLEQQIAIQENTLQLLTGQLPGRINRSAALSTALFDKQLSPGLPVALISRRPDVRSQELSLTIANARVGIAQANMYPALNITAGGGLESFKSSNWFNIPNSLFGLVAGSVAQPLFLRRELKTQYEIAKVEREQAVIRFRQSVLQATTEVSNALIQYDKLNEQKLIAVNQADTLRAAVRNAQLLFKSDMANYLEVITAQSNALQAELNVAALQRAQLNSVVELYRSLGGGWK